MPPGKANPQWELAGFEDAFERWVNLEEPAPELRIRVVNWMFTRREDPYEGMIRESSFPNLWYGEVSGSLHGTGQVVVCTMWIEESTRTVRCDMIATLNPPII